MAHPKNSKFIGYCKGCQRRVYETRDESKPSYLGDNEVAVDVVRIGARLGSIRHDLLCVVCNNTEPQYRAFCNHLKERLTLKNAAGSSLWKLAKCSEEWAWVLK